MLSPSIVIFPVCMLLCKFAPPGRMLVSSLCGMLFTVGLCRPSAVGPARVRRPSLPWVLLLSAILWLFAKTFNIPVPTVLCVFG